MVNSCTFVSFCHAGLVQHVAGKCVFNSAWANKHINNIGKINRSKRPQLPFVFLAILLNLADSFLKENMFGSCQTRSAVLSESAIKPRFLGSAKTIPRTHAVLSGVAFPISSQA